MKKKQAILLAVVLILMIGLNFSFMNANRFGPELAVASDLPCYNQWQKCLDSGKSTEFCDGVWYGCMCAKYGAFCFD